ncbi:restriction endonuclease subunit S [Xanthobacter autotrophicus]|uniref:restriction endonuclease subunit S n=1 Tax=Xanthobacter autotrophicus TaxID=280 RepID=UPI00372A78A3
MSSSIGRWDVPDSWRWAPLADIVEVAQNLVDPAAVPEMPHIAPNHIKSGEREILPFSTVRADGVISPKQRFFPGQILFTKIRPYLLKSVLIDFEGVCSADMYPLRVRGTAESKLVLYWLTSPDFRDEIAHEQGRSVLPKINQPALLRSAFPLPPLPEQRRIVAKIDSLTAKSRRARDHLDHIPRLVEKYKQAILAAAFRGDLTRDWRGGEGSPPYDIQGVDGQLSNLTSLPSGWTWTSMKTVGQITGGLTKNASRGSHPLQVPYLRVGNVYANELRLDEVSEIGCTEGEAQRTALEPGDLLIVEGNGSLDQIGRVAMWNGELPVCSHQNHLIRARMGVDVLPRFALFWLLSPGGRDAIETVASSSSGLHTLSISKVGGLPIPLCSWAQQAEIVRRIETAFAWIERLAAEATSARKLIDRLDQAVLAKAFRGELVPQDPADEPASVLLERIRAERAAAPKARRGRRPAVEA